MPCPPLTPARPSPARKRATRQRASQPWAGLPEYAWPARTALGVGCGDDAANRPSASLHPRLQLNAACRGRDRVCRHHYGITHRPLPRMRRMAAEKLSGLTRTRPWTMVGSGRAGPGERITPPGPRVRQANQKARTMSLQLGITRCAWVGHDPLFYQAYHDQEWGVPVHDATAFSSSS